MAMARANRVLSLFLRTSEKAGNLFNFTKEGFGNLPFKRAGGLVSWGGELPHPWPV